MTTPSALDPLRLAQRAASLKPSATLAQVARVKELIAGGESILELTAGEPDFGPPKAAEAAAIACIQAGEGRYTAAAGTPALRAAAAEWASQTTGLEYGPEELVVTTGAKLALCQALLALVENGDSVLFPSPCWTSYPEMIRLAGGCPVKVPSGDDFLPRVEDLENARAKAQNPRAIMLCTPGNPTGVVYPRALLEEIGDWAKSHGLALLSDEIYANLVFGNAQHVSPIEAGGMKDSSIWIGGMSKAYAMTGWRMGFLAASAPIAKRITGLQSQLASSPNAISQAASLAALQEGGAEREAMRVEFEKRAILVADAIDAIPGLACPRPEGAFYAFPSCKKLLGKTDPETGRVIRSGDDLSELLLEADQVATIGGSAFGAPDCLRLSFAASEGVLQEALKRIARRVAGLT